MTDTILIVLSVIVFLVSFVLSRSPREAGLITRSIWSVLATVALLGVAIVTLVQGEYRRAGGAVLLLLFILTVTGFIPGLLIHWSEQRRAHRMPPPPQPPSSGSPSASSLAAVSELFPEDPVASDRKETDLEVCPRCGHSLCRRDGRFGPFFGCSAYPRCRYTKSVT